MALTLFNFSGAFKNHQTHKTKIANGMNENCMKKSAYIYDQPYIHWQKQQNHNILKK